MKTRISQIVAIIVLTALISSALTYAVTRRFQQREIDRLNSQLNELRAENDRLKQTPAALTPTPTQPTEQLPAGTADWQVFTSNQFNFSLRYPKDWQAETNTDEGVVVITKNNQTKRIVRVTTNVEGRSTNEILSELSKSGEQITDVETFEAINASAIKLTIRRRNETIYRVIVPADNRLVIMDITGSNELLNEMIRTIRLTP